MTLSSVVKYMYIISVGAGKGGVGKSTVTAALATALQRQGQKVGVLDADLYGPSMGQILPLDDPPRVDGDRIWPGRSSGLSVVSLAHFRKVWQSMGLRAPVANATVDRLLNGVEWGDLDILLIDLPPGTGDIQLTLCQRGVISAALLVTTPQKVALGDVRRAAHLFRQLEVPMMGVVENMSYLEVDGARHHPFGEGGGRLLADELSLPLLAQIPIDPDLASSCDEGRPIRSSRFHPLAAHVAGWFDPGHVAKAEPDGAHFVRVRWPDGVEGKLRLSELQRRCPCAGCAVEDREVNSDLTAEALHTVGRYGLRFDFVSGCCDGIYPYSMLREMV